MTTREITEPNGTQGAKAVFRDLSGKRTALHECSGRNIVYVSYFGEAKIMHDVTIGEKGQITVPKAIRDHYNLSKGDRVRMIDLGNGIMEVILLSHSKDLPPPTVRSDRNASPGNMKDAARRSAVTRYRRADRK